MFDLDRYISTHFRDPGRAGDERVVTCFFCGGKKKLYINVKKRKFNCFKCGAGRGATLISFIMDHLGIDENTAFNILRSNEYTGYAPQSYVEIYEQRKSTPLRPTVLPSEYEPLYPLEGVDSILGQRAIAYLRRRGLTDADFLLYRLGFCIDGRYQRRIIIPVLRDGEVVYFMARLFLGYGQRYLNPELGEVPEHPSNLIFNWDTAKHASTLRLCEGVFDGMALGETAGALFGKQVHDGQFRLLEAGAFEQIEVWIDPDAQTKAEQLAFALREFGKPVTICHLAFGDPGETRVQDIPVQRYDGTGWASHFKRRYFSEVSHESTRSSLGLAQTSIAAPRSSVRAPDVGHSRR